MSPHETFELQIKAIFLEFLGGPELLHSLKTMSPAEVDRLLEVARQAVAGALD